MVVVCNSSKAVLVVHRFMKKYSEQNSLESPYIDENSLEHRLVTYVLNLMW